MNPDINNTSVEHIDRRLSDLGKRSLPQAKKRLLWSRIKRELSPRSAIIREGVFLRMRFSRFALALFIAVFITTTSFGAVAYADNSKPGDFFYSLDRAIEDVRLVLAPESRKAELQITFAEERFEEVAALLSASTDDDLHISLNVGTTSPSTETNSVSTSTENASSTTATSTPNHDFPSTTAQAVFKEKNASFERTEASIREIILRLEESKKRLEARGDDVAVAAITGIIADISGLLSVHGTENFRAEIEQKIESRKNGRERLAYELKIQNGGGTTTRVEVKVDEKKNDTEVSFKIKTKDEKFGTSTGGSRSRSSSSDEDDEDDDGDKDSSRNKKDNRNRGDNDRDDDDKRGDRDDNNRRGDNDDEDDEDDEDRDERIKTFVKICHIPPGSLGGRKTLEIPLQAVGGHLVHGDTMGVCAEDGGATTTPDTVAPLITTISHISATTTASISWETNENTHGTLWYGTSTPLDIGFATKSETTGGATTTHTISLTNLGSGIAYRYILSIRDESGNTASSSERSFTTIAELPEMDVTAPVISNLSTVVGSTTATVSWSTNESSRSSLWYGTSTPVLTDMSPAFSSANLSLLHNFEIQNLAASSTYHYLVSASDVSGNTATSTELTFSTPSFE